MKGCTIMASNSLIRMKGCITMAYKSLTSAQIGRHLKIARAERRDVSITRKLTPHTAHTHLA
eukprot:1160387-Pelagomonas_calceolata.AAC.3